MITVAIISFILGGICGMGAMCLVIAGKDDGDG